MLTTVMLAEDYFYPEDLDELELGDRITLQFDFEKKEAIFEWRRKNGDLVEKEKGKNIFHKTLKTLMEKVRFGLSLNLSPDVLVYYKDEWIIENKGRKHFFASMPEAIKNLISILGEPDVDEEALWENRNYYVEQGSNGFGFKVINKATKDPLEVHDPKFIEIMKEFLSHFEKSRREDELERVKKIADKNTLYPHEAKSMPHYSLMTVREFFNRPEWFQKLWDQFGEDNVVYFRFNFSKLEAISEIWSREGKLLDVELWGPGNFNFEEFTGMVEGGLKWKIIHSDTGEITEINYDRKSHEYVIHISDKSNLEIHVIDDEGDFSDFILARLGGIRRVYCDCPEGCPKCDGHGLFIEKIEKVAG